MHAGCRVTAIAALGIADATALLTVRPDVGRLVAGLAAPHAWVSEAGADKATVTLASAGLWCAALWLGIGLLAATAIRLPGSVGRVAEFVSRMLLPAAVYRVVAGAAGLGVLLAPVAAGARGASGPPPHTGQVSTSAAPSIPAPTWPSDPPRSIPALPAPGWPTSPPLPRAPAAPTPSAEQAPQPIATNRSHDAAARHGSGIVVQPGDSLWRVVAADLGPRATPTRIAAVWPRWYAANRTTIGADPDLIQPGERLRAPAPTQAKS
jgi:hypothetical protein